jgi:prepilin-type N-terminal cleavage/methylation domain-containing protein
MRRETGFTVVEMLVGLAVMGVLFAIGAPVVLKTIHTAKVSSVGYDCNILVRRAKSEAIKKNSPAVVRYHSAWNVLRAWVDVHGATVNDPPDFVFLQDAGALPTETDHEIGQCALPAAVSWGGPPDDANITVGFTTVGTDNVAVLQPDGTVQDIGTFRFGDTRGNYLAIQISPAATARVTLLKWDEEDMKWREQGEEGKRWVWF